MHRAVRSALLALPFALLPGAPLLAQRAPTTGPPLVSRAQPVTAETLRLVADLSERQLVVYRGGDVVERFEIAVGEPEHPTPTGDFSIERLVWNPGWVPPNTEWAEDETAKSPNDPDNPMKVVKLFFHEPDYYIHGTGATESLGSAASHGCLRMAPQAVARLGRLVMAHGGEDRSSGWYERVLDGDDSRTVRLDEPVTIVVRQ